MGQQVTAFLVTQRRSLLGTGREVYIFIKIGLQ